jgi:transcription initiation factor TFIIE subunit alpha
MNRKRKTSHGKISEKTTPKSDANNKHMKLPDEEIEDVVSKVAGEDVVRLIKALKNKKNVSEFTLADSIKKEINLTRNMLYRLYDSSLVSFIRKKDKKKGWYIYYWTFNTDRIKYLAKQIKKQRLEQLRERLEREKSSSFFACKNQCIRLNFEQATDFEFKCPECGELLDQVDNTQKKVELEKEIKKLEKELK